MNRDRERFITVVVLLVLSACSSDRSNHDNKDQRPTETVSLYEKNHGIRLPDELRTGLGIQLREVEEKIIVPHAAVIDGAESEFVYVENGDHFVRTPVTIVAASRGQVEITEGLLPGDKVVTHGSEDLWMIELLALRGGSPCCPVRNQSGKGSRRD